MTDDAKRRWGAALIATAAVLAVACLVLWTRGTRDADREALTAEYEAAITGRPYEEPEADRTAPLALGAIAAVAFLGGIILLATARPSEAEPLPAPPPA